MKNIIYTVLILIAVSCQTEKATTNFSKTNIFEKPIENVDVILQSQIVDSERGDTIYLANNTRIIIPENSFVDSLGGKIKGAVEINFQEYHTEAEVILSGIPMQYDSAGTKYTLETDGMFKLSGKQKGSRVEIAKNKSLKVKTQSYKEDTPCFNYYTQNKEGKWNYKVSKSRVLNEEEVIKNEIKKIKLIDENAIGIDLQINTEKYPELSDFKNIAWIYNGDKADTLKLRLLANVKWNEFEFQKTDESLYSYLLVGTHKKHHFTMPITPAFSNEELLEVKMIIASQVKAKEIAIAKEKARYQREAVVSNFGTHNWDRCVAEDMLVLNTELKYNEPIKYFYVINKSSKYRFVNKYEYKKNSHLRFVEGGSVAIIAFLEEEGKIAYTFGNSIKDNSILELKKHSKTIKTPSDLQALIELI